MPHYFKQQNSYITDEIWADDGTIDLFISDIYEDLKDNLLVFEKAIEFEFKDLLKETIIGYINECEIRNNGRKY